jgi:ribosome-associated translation inhibitor RaiA
MVKIIFRNLEESELAKDITFERVLSIVDRFPELDQHKMSVTLSMDNSPLKPGPDLFKVKLLINGKKFKNITLEKSAASLYTALAKVVEQALERLNRFGDRQRVKNRNQARKILQPPLFEKNSELYDEKQT